MGKSYKAGYLWSLALVKVQGILQGSEGRDVSHVTKEKHLDVGAS